MPKTTTTTYASPQAALAALYAECHSWRAAVILLKERTGQTFDRALLNRIARDKQAAPNSVRLALGFPVLLPALACPVHGVVHVAKRCPSAGKPRRRDWFDWPTGELAALIRERVEMK